MIFQAWPQVIRVWLADLTGQACVPHTRLGAQLVNESFWEIVAVENLSPHFPSLHIHLPALLICRSTFLSTGLRPPCQAALDEARWSTLTQPFSIPTRSPASPLQPWYSGFIKRQEPFFSASKQDNFLHLSCMLLDPRPVLFQRKMKR